MLRHLPVREPRPDAAGFIADLLGKSNSGRPLLVEYIVDEMVMRPVVTELLGRTWVPYSADVATQQLWLDNVIAFWAHMGYDLVRLERGLGFPERKVHAADTAPGAVGQRAWADEHQGTISSWDDFERYPWPSVSDADLAALEYVATHLPDGMGLITSHAGGVFEHLSWIMSLEGLSFALYEQPDLVAAVAQRLGELMTDYYRRLLTLPNVIAIFPGDDMGFRSATLIAPDALRRYILPWHRRFAEMAHARGLPYFLHSCGNVAAIMEDLIADVQIDGKHSFEDAIMPAEVFQARYGDRVAVLGGVDLNILGGGTPQDVRRRTRELLRVCGAHGRFAVGSGNSIPSYVPPANYLAMIDEALDHRP